MKSEFSSYNEMWAGLLIEELIRGSVNFFAVCPGSRSTPLALAVAEFQRAGTVVHYDERGASFCALGHARATGQPAALICTSGTAVANMFPAVLEAYYDHIPLVLLTADRPPELQDCGANQTIDQVGLFGKHVRWHGSITAPAKDQDPLVLLDSIDQALSHSSRPNAGPVHLNLMYREPLLPDKSNPLVSLPPALESWASGNKPYTVETKETDCDRSDSSELAVQLLSGRDNVLIVAGRMQSSADQEAVRQLANATGWLLLPDIASGLRLGNQDTKTIAHFDLILAAGIELIEPGTPILQMGRPPVSKALLTCLGRLKPEIHIKVQNFAQKDDPMQTVTNYVYIDIDIFCRAILNNRAASSPITNAPVVLELNNQVSTFLDSVSSDDNLTEPGVARLVSQRTPSDSCLFVASSRPIRDMDRYASSQGPRIPIGCNRGVSGIDGTIASAVGFACGHDKPLVLLIGDLAFLHDLNSLALLKELNYPATIVLINNNGGGIFSFLQVASQTEHFEKYFGTPHGLEFENCARMFGLDYSQPKSRAEFISLFDSIPSMTQHQLIEVKTDRKENYSWQQRLIGNIRSRLLT